MAVVVIVIMVVAMCADLFDCHDAAVGDFTLYMLKLDCRVLNVELAAQSPIDFFENPRAFGWRNISDRHMAGQRMRLRSETPDMQIVNVFNTLDFLEHRSDLVQGKPSRCSFEQDIQRFFHDANRRP